MSDCHFMLLGQLLSGVKGGGTPERDMAEYWSGSIPWATVKDFRDGVHVLHGIQEYISEQGLKNSASKLIPPHIPIICTRMAVGRIAMADFAVAINQDLKALFPKSEVDPTYLLRAIESVRPEIEATAIGSTVKGISLDQLLSVKVFFPNSEKEQKKIAEVLSVLDHAIEQTEALIAKQRRIKSGLMQDLLTKGIDEHGNIRSETTHAFKDSPLGRIPVEWDVAPMSAFQLPGRPFIKTGPFGSSLNTKHWVEDGVPVITIGSLGESGFLKKELLYVSESTAHALSPYRVKPGDIVFSRVADTGRVLVITTEQNGWIISSNFMRISLNESEVSPPFLFRSIVFNPATRDQLRVLSNASGREVVNTAILSALHFAWPGLGEQNRINDKLDQIDGAISKSMHSLEKLLSLKLGLMHRAIALKFSCLAPQEVGKVVGTPTGFQSFVFDP